MHSGDYNRALCLPHSLCRNFRVCERCARIRQGKIANAIEELKRLCGGLTWSIVYPHDAGKGAADKAKLEFLRKCAPEGAIWTIEQSRKTQALHVNIITPATGVKTLKHGHLWQQEIVGNVRHVGAYIAKRGQMPDPESYPGRIYGTAGNLWQCLSRASEFPLVQAAAAQFAIDSKAMTDQAEVQRIIKSQRLSNPTPEISPPRELTKDERREIAARWLPDILAAQRERSGG